MNEYTMNTRAISGTIQSAIADTLVVMQDIPAVDPLDLEELDGFMKDLKYFNHEEYDFQRFYPLTCAIVEAEGTDAVIIYTFTKEHKGAWLWS